jgi:hypothetical protein
MAWFSGSAPGSTRGLTRCWAPSSAPVDDTVDFSYRSGFCGFCKLTKTLPQYGSKLQRRSIKLLHTMILHLALANDEARMLNIEDDHDQEHKSRIEDVE